MKVLKLSYLNDSSLNDWLFTVLITVLYLLVNISYAADQPMWKKTLQYHGFVTQGLIKTDDNHFFGHSETGSAALTELGVNVSSRASKDIMFSAQLLARRAGEMYDGSIELDYALIDYTVSSTASSQYGMRLGRFKNPLGLYNDTRDVAFTRPSVFMPQAIYFDNLRNAFLSNDGLLLYSDLWGENSNISFQLGIGKTPVDLNLEYALLGEDTAGTIKDEDMTIISRLLYERGSLKLALSYANTSLKMHDTNQIFVGDGVFEVDIWIVSLQYYHKDWTITAEWAQQPLTWNSFSAFFPAGSTGEYEPGGYFLQTSYQLHENIELLLRYEEGYADKNDKDGIIRETKLAAAPFFITSPAHNYYTNDWVIGARWDVSSQFMLRAEYHSVEGAYFLSRRENDVATVIKDWNLFSILASYRF